MVAGRVAVVVARVVLAELQLEDRSAGESGRLGEGEMSSNVFLWRAINRPTRLRVGVDRAVHVPAALRVVGVGSAGAEREGLALGGVRCIYDFALDVGEGEVAVVCPAGA